MKSIVVIFFLLSLSLVVNARERYTTINSIKITQSNKPYVDSVYKYWKAQVKPVDSVIMMRTYEAKENQRYLQDDIFVGVLERYFILVPHSYPALKYLKHYKSKDTIINDTLCHTLISKSIGAKTVITYKIDKKNRTVFYEVQLSDDNHSYAYTYSYGINNELTQVLYYEESRLVYKTLNLYKDGLLQQVLKYEGPDLKKWLTTIFYFSYDLAK